MYCEYYERRTIIHYKSVSESYRGAKEQISEWDPYRNFQCDHCSLRTVGEASQRGLEESQARSDLLTLNGNRMFINYLFLCQRTPVYSNHRDATRASPVKSGEEKAASTRKRTHLSTLSMPSM